MSSFASGYLNITSSILFFARVNRSSIRRSSEASFALPEKSGEVARTATITTRNEILITIGSSHVPLGRPLLRSEPLWHPWHGRYRPLDAPVAPLDLKIAPIGGDKVQHR